ncbi:MAG: hypothetical protein R3F29_14045, partial [Planctomycetota bacterium]
LPGRTELGDLRFALAPLFVGGRMVFDCEDHSSRPYVEKLEGELRPDHEGNWRQVRGLQLTLGADGQFALRGEQPEGRYRLAMMTYQHLPVDPVEFTPGASDLRIEVHCGNQPEVTCLVTDQVLASQLRVTFVQPDAPPTVGGLNAMIGRDPMQADHMGRTDTGAERFRWRALPDGVYTLRIHAMPATPVVEIPNVVLPLPDGGDPRLSDIDLRQLVTSLRLVVRVDDSIQRRGSTDVMAFVLPEPSDDDWRGVTVYNGEAILPVPKGPVDLLVLHYAGKPVTLRDVEGEAEVTVGPWPSVELTFVGLELLPEGAELIAIAQQPGYRESNDDRRRYLTDSRSGYIASLTQKGHSFATVEGGKATLEMAEDTASLGLNLRFADSSTSLRQFSPTQLVAGQPVTVQLSTEELHAAITRLQQKSTNK